MNKMNRIVVFFLLFLIFSCKNEKLPDVVAQEVVDQSIMVSGGALYKASGVTFDFRNREYALKLENNKRVMQRSFIEDSSKIIDIKKEAFQRFIDGKEVMVADSMAVKYFNSINSVFYFALLPYGLNDPAVNKKYLGDVKIGSHEYYKVQVTFDKENGGEDYEDIYLYWFNKENFKPDYLAYKFKIDGGGLRFRVALNERIVNGIRFVDYENYAPKSKKIDFFKIEELYQKKELKLLSKIELENIKVNQH